MSRRLFGLALRQRAHKRLANRSGLAFKIVMCIS